MKIHITFVIPLLLLDLINRYVLLLTQPAVVIVAAVVVEVWSQVGAHPSPCGRAHNVGVVKTETTYGGESCEWKD